jgi:DNA-directed RNA polymerase specialized sigma24 family protein
VKATALPPFQFVFEQHANAVLTFLNGAVGVSEAEDCFQETMLSALRAYPRLGDGSNPAPWSTRMPSPTMGSGTRFEVSRASSERPSS